MSGWVACSISTCFILAIMGLGEAGFTARIFVCQNEVMNYSCPDPKYRLQLVEGLLLGLNAADFLKRPTGPTCKKIDSDCYYWGEKHNVQEFHSKTRSCCDGHRSCAVLTPPSHSFKMCGKQFYHWMMFTFKCIPSIYFEGKNIVSETFNDSDNHCLTNSDWPDKTTSTTSLSSTTESTYSTSYQERTITSTVNTQAWNWTSLDNNSTTPTPAADVFTTTPDAKAANATAKDLQVNPTETSNGLTIVGVCLVVLLFVSVIVILIVVAAYRRRHQAGQQEIHTPRSDPAAEAMRNDDDLPFPSPPSRALTYSLIADGSDLGRSISPLADSIGAPASLEQDMNIDEVAMPDTSRPPTLTTPEVSKNVRFGTSTGGENRSPARKLTFV